MILLTSGGAHRTDIDVRRAMWDDRSPTAALTERRGRHDHHDISWPAGHQGDDATWDRATHALFTYDIFPPRRMRAVVCSTDARVRPGVLIIQRILAGPVAAETAVRVEDVFERHDTEHHIGFSYVTLQGHAERGVATFSLVRSRGGDMRFEIETWSRPGGWQGWLIAPIARVLQRRFTLEALHHVRARALGAPPDRSSFRTW